MNRLLALSSLEALQSLVQSGALRHNSFDLKEESNSTGRVQEFMREHEKCFDRDLSVGHITGSAMVTNPSGTKVLLTLHHKLGKWLQLGGHCDGDSFVARVAWREAIEEAGIEPLGIVDLNPLLGGLSTKNDSASLHASSVPLPFDVDIHMIPARKSDPEHEHFDLRYLIVADDSRPIVISAESKDLRWVGLEEARYLTQERSMIRQFDKVEALFPFVRDGHLVIVDFRHFDPTLL